MPDQGTKARPRDQGPNKEARDQKRTKKGPKKDQKNDQKRTKKEPKKDQKRTKQGPKRTKKGSKKDQKMIKKGPKDGTFLWHPRFSFFALWFLGGCCWLIFFAKQRCYFLYLLFSTPASI
jgi:hypothetical protein